MDTHRRLRAAALAAAALAAAAPALPSPALARPAEEAPAAARPKHPADLKFPDQKFDFRKTERCVLPNGMVVHLLEDHTLPLVNGVAYFRGGAVFDPPGKEGLAALTCGMTRFGGTTHVAADALDEELDMMAGALAVAGGSESCSASFSFLSRDLDRGVALFADVLRNPAYDPGRFERVRMSSAQGIQRQLQSPGGVLGRAFPRTVFGSHPYGSRPTAASVMGLTLEDLKACHARWFHPEGFVLAVAGDFEKAKILASLEKALEGWAAAPEPLPNRPPEVPREYRGGHYVVPMRGVTQTNIRMGHVGPKQATEERVVCDVMNLILGGGSFWSRMTRVVRTKEGLAYDVNSMFTRASQGGAFQASTQTKAATTYRAIALMLDLIREIREKPVSADELGQAKDFIVNRFVHNFENPGALAAQYARLEFEGYPENWLQRYLEVVKSVTVEDVQRAAKEWLRPDGLSIVVVGDPSLLDAPPAGFPEAKTLAAE